MSDDYINGEIGKTGQECIAFACIETARRCIQYAEPSKDEVALCRIYLELASKLIAAGDVALYGGIGSGGGDATAIAARFRPQPGNGGAV